jgi:glycosyltransferase EpsE
MTEGAPAMHNSTSTKVSVVMATHNCEATIDDAIASIAKQSYSMWELIVCDDGSTDRTRAKLYDWQQQLGGRMTILLNSENRKLQHSLNRCLAVADGQLIARMDGDDLCDPKRLEHQVGMLSSRPDVHLVGTYMQRFSDAGLADVVRTPLTPDKWTFLRHVPFAHATVVARREVFEQLNGYDESPGINRVEDLDLWFRFFERGFTGVNLPQPLYLVREDMAAIKRRTFRNRWNLLRVTLNGYRKLGYPATTYWRPLVQFTKAFVPARALWLHREVQRGLWNLRGTRG